MQQFDMGFGQENDDIVLGAGEIPAEETAHIKFHPNFLNNAEASALCDTLQSRVDWKNESLWIFGRERLVPRLVAWYGDAEARYSYSGKVHEPLPWIEPLLSIKKRLEETLGCDFNSVLCNLYRDGADSMGWHADDERELGDEPVIASVSLGASRAFHLKHKKNPKLRHKMSLTSGSLLVMQGATQEYWLHQVPKEPKVTEARINLTFRKVIL